MKNSNLLLIAGVLFVFTLNSCSKDDAGDGFLASTAQQNRVALLEDFTGVRCQYCPDGHERAKALLAANPGKFIVIAVHGGDYATPATGWPNFTTMFGGYLIAQAKVSGYPAGTINREMGLVFGLNPQMPPYGYALGRDQWAAAATFMIAQKAPVNIGATATYNSGTRLLTVKVDLYYTSDQTGSNNINVALLQDKLYGPQSIVGSTEPNYEQNHVLRTFITGTWGDVISATGETKGTKVSKTYAYSVPTDYNGTSADGGGAVVIDNLNIVVFVTAGQTDVLNAKALDVK